MNWYLYDTCGPDEALDDATGRQQGEACGMVDSGTAETLDDAREQAARAMVRRCALLCVLVVIEGRAELAYTATQTETRGGGRKVSYRATYSVEV